MSLVQVHIDPFEFEKIFVVPSGNPVFKDSHFIDSEKRIEMLNIAFKDIENVYIDNRETLKKGVSFPFIDEKKWKKKLIQKVEGNESYPPHSFWVYNRKKTKF